MRNGGQGLPLCIYMGVEPKIGVPQNGWFIMENPMNKWMIWGYPYFWKHPYIYINIYTYLLGNDHMADWKTDHFSRCIEIYWRCMDVSRHVNLAGGIKFIEWQWVKLDQLPLNRVENKHLWNHHLQAGPLLVINRVITPINGVTNG